MNKVDFECTVDFPYEVLVLFHYYFFTHPKVTSTISRPGQLKQTAIAIWEIFVLLSCQEALSLLVNVFKYLIFFVSLTGLLLNLHCNL